jgi:D-serine deaminase-like pyridoxal phosphate-dependent protein
MIKGLADFATPLFVVDRAVARRNAERMRDKAARSGVLLRPHVKTHKTVEGARLQLGADTGPITVSTVAEAEDFADNGFEDITYAVPAAPSKLDRCAALAGRVARLNLLVDSHAAVAALEELASSNGLTFDVFLKVDCGYHRAGVEPSDPEAVRLARRLHTSAPLRFRGILTHAGHSYHARTREEIVPIAEAEQACLTGFAGVLEGQGITGLCRSVGSTPTMSVAETVDAEEMRPGNYLFHDAFQAAIGSCRLDDCAAWVVACVIGAYPSRREAIVDCGALALSKDAGATHVDPDAGFGVATDLEGRRLPCRLRSLSQEHGILFFDDMSAIPAVGSLVRVIPNHSCLTAALYESYVVIEDGEVVGEWWPSRGW